ncbi:MAG: aldehyde dehydrogenase family protein [Planctomycetota bacterium]
MSGSSAGKHLQSLNPATGEVVGEVPVAPAEEIVRRVAAAREAQGSWGRLPVEERRAALLPAAEKLIEQRESLGDLLTREMGKPLGEGVGEVNLCGAGMEAALDEIVEALQPETLEDDRTRSTIHRDPFGVCAAITPWNFPLAMPHWLVIPALMAGNTVVLKPSEETPLIAQAYVDLLKETLPEKVLQIVHGADEQGKALVAAEVDLIAFTGSRETGKRILNAASSGLKRVILELGGKDPMIVLADANLDKAARFAVQNSFRNAGQVCVSTERIYVAEEIAEEFERRVTELTAELKVGDPTGEGIDIGPMISAAQRRHVLRQIDEAVKQGARVAAGGAGHHDNFVMPTVLTGVSPEMEIMRDETFGPVACIARFRSVEDAIRRANDTPFGLGASVFGGDEGASLEVARRLDAGMVGVNRGCGGATGSPWVGAKESGYGFHSSREGHRQFTQPRVVSVRK